jgi:hypothetical protein
MKNKFSIYIAADRGRCNESEIIQLFSLTNFTIIIIIISMYRHQHHGQKVNKRVWN